MLPLINTFDHVGVSCSLTGSGNVTITSGAKRVRRRDDMQVLEKVMKLIQIDIIETPPSPPYRRKDSAIVKVCLKRDLSLNRQKTTLFTESYRYKRTNARNQRFYEQINDPPSVDHEAIAEFDTDDSGPNLKRLVTHYFHQKNMKLKIG